jgi:hypothetical protein
MIRERPDAYRLRRRAVNREPWRDFTQLSDDELIEEWLRRIENDEYDPWADDWYQRASTHPETWGAVPESLPGRPLKELLKTYFVGFEVQDGAGDPYPGLAYVLEGPGRAREEGTLPASALIRRSDVLDDDYRLTLAMVDDIAWASTTAQCGQEVELLGHVTGHADGTTVEIRIFRELRETDDDVIATIDATVAGGMVIARWGYDVNASPATHPQLRFVAELRVPGVPGWAKTAVPVVFELPAIRVARWSRRATAPGKPVEIRVKVAGIADGSPMTIEVFKQRRDGAHDCLASFEGLAVVEGGVVLPWTYEADAADPKAANEAECFFVATSEEFLDATRTSGPLWISRAVGRKVKRKRGRRSHRPSADVG